MKALLGIIFATTLMAGCSSTPSYNNAAISQTRQTVVNTALQQIGKPYQWGGTSPSQGFDCSGLVYYSHQAAHIKVPRVSIDQLRHATKTPTRQPQPGDLLFFQITNKPSHVAIYIGNGKFIHAPSSGGKVRTDRLSDPYWSSRLVRVGHYF